MVRFSWVAAPMKVGKLKNQTSVQLRLGRWSWKTQWRTWTIQASLYNIFLPLCWKTLPSSMRRRSTQVVWYDQDVLVALAKELFKEGYGGSFTTTLQRLWCAPEQELVVWLNLKTVSFTLWKMILGGCCRLAFNSFIFSQGIWIVDDRPNYTGRWHLEQIAIKLLPNTLWRSRCLRNHADHLFVNRQD